MASVTAHVWKGRKVFVTGHTGFKGSWLAQCLQNLGCEVYGYALAPEGQFNHFGSLEWKSLVSEIADIRDYQRLLQAIQRASPEVIFHLAAQPLVLRSYEDPRYTYETNVMGTLNLLEAVRQTSSVRAVVVVTSDKCYENHETTKPYREEDPLGGYDPYSSSKGCVEILTSSYRRSYFPVEQYKLKHNVLAASVRAGNVIGGGDWTESRLIPDIVRAYRDKKRMVVRHPDARRPWQHVLDPLNGYLLLAERLLAGDISFARAFNFGPASDESWTVHQLLRYAKSIWPSFEYVVKDSDRHEAQFLMLDSSLAKTKLGWRPALGIEQALKWTFDWYQQFLNEGQCPSLTQVRSYFKS